ncbi:hypothetical protein CBR_g46632 [Chara braunii]|uniref:Uncharacterized protein n=1 Tax=Chara braunii TaxID=69332 RepID=A0A388M0P4_CHABU|nr:hypothetical protein CBR_g46632 [Chara braunii]|eukprot:GBG88144.1 hypothetical protein CBR_g46632 [Chara braunii]
MMLPKSWKLCHQPQKGDAIGKVLRVKNVDLRNRWDNAHSSGGDHHDNKEEEDINDDVNDHDDYNSDMALWNQKIGDGHNDGDNESLESSQNGGDDDDDDDDDNDDDDDDDDDDNDYDDDNDDDDDDDDDDDGDGDGDGDMNCWNQKTGDEERDLGGTVYWDKKRSEDRRVDLKDSNDMNGSEQEGEDDNFQKALNRQGRKRD